MFSIILLVLLFLITKPLSVVRITFDQQMIDNADFKVAALACYSMLRGFMNSMDAESSDCSKRFMCEVIKICSYQSFFIRNKIIRM